jgi:ATP-binding cassette subfamily F protein 3
MLVTHDRYLLGRVADHLLRIHEGKAETREGGYEDHRAWVDLDLGSEDEAGDGVKEPKKAAKPEKAAEKKPEPVAEAAKPKAVDKEKQKQLKRLERHVSEAEAKVTELEARMDAVQKELAEMDPADWQPFSDKLNVQKSIEEELAYAMAAWEEAQGALESAQG